MAGASNHIEKFKVEKLFGCKDYELTFKDGILVLVGENGSGKTTILRLLFYVLSGQLKLLMQYEFTSITLVIKNSRFVFKPQEIDAVTSRLKRLPPSVRHHLMRIRDRGHHPNYVMSELKEISGRYGISFRDLFEELDPESDVKGDLEKKVNEIKALLNGKILYLPTYRRIEEQLKSIFKNLDEDDIRRHAYSRSYSRSEDARNYIELTEFGMEDVERFIDLNISKVKEFAITNLNKLALEHLNDIVEGVHDVSDLTRIKELAEDQIQDVLDRIPDAILSASNKRKLFTKMIKFRDEQTLGDSTKIIFHYFLKLLNFQDRLIGLESNIKKYCDVCNSYMTNKEFIYDGNKYKFTINDKDERRSNTEIKPQYLSSGEKQIASLFSYLYLSNDEEYLILIDEPELSLSVPWQRKFLIDVLGGKQCNGLLAITHSPFIYDNRLVSYARSLEEFSKN